MSINHSGLVDGLGFEYSESHRLYWGEYKSYNLVVIPDKNPYFCFVEFSIKPRDFIRTVLIPQKPKTYYSENSIPKVSINIAKKTENNIRYDMTSLSSLDPAFETITYENLKISAKINIFEENTIINIIYAMDKLVEYCEVNNLCQCCQRCGETENLTIHAVNGCAFTACEYCYADLQIKAHDCDRLTYKQPDRKKAYIICGLILLIAHGGIQLILDTIFEFDFLLPLLIGLFLPVSIIVTLLFGKLNNNKMTKKGFLFCAFFSFACAFIFTNITTCNSEVQNIKYNYEQLMNDKRTQLEDDDTYYLKPNLRDEYATKEAYVDAKMAEYEDELNKGDSFYYQFTRLPYNFVHTYRIPYRIVSSTISLGFIVITSCVITGLYLMKRQTYEIKSIKLTNINLKGEKNAY